MLRTSFVNREEEVKGLKRWFEEVASGRGKTIFISGEAGIGKTALIEQLREEALSKGARFLSAECTARAVAPYTPFTEAFSGIIESLLPPEEFSEVEEVFLINRAGILIAHQSKKEGTVDREVVGGMLTAIQDFVATSFAPDREAKGLGKLEYGKLAILLEHGVNIFVASVLSGKECPAIRADMRNAVQSIETRYDKILPIWDGDRSKLVGIEQNIKPLTEKRYVIEPKLDSSLIESKKLEIFERVLKTCLELTQTKPLVLFLDHLELADESSLQLLHYLARNTRNAKVMLCCTYRPEELETNAALTELIHSMRRENLIKELSIEHFDLDRVAQLVNLTYYNNEFPSEFIKLVNEKTGGNPFFISELFKSLVSEGMVYKKAGKWRAKPLVDLELPKTIKDAVFYRVNKLGSEAKEALKYASVIGKSFDFQTLQKALEIGEEKLADLLEKILESGIILENEVLKFDHGVTQESIYKEIPKFKRVIIHKKVGRVLEQLNAKQLDKVATLLVHHFSEGKVYEKVYEYACRAGELTKKVFSLVEAAKYYEQALDALKELPGERKLAELILLSKLSEINIILGEWDKALAYANESSKLCVELEDHKQRALSYMHIAEIYSNRSEWDEALEAYKLSLDIFKKTNDFHGSAEAHRGLGLVYRRKGDYDKAIEHYNQSIEQAEKLGAIKLTASAYVDLGLVYRVKGDLELAANYTKKSLALFEKLEELYELARAYNNLGTIYYEQEAWDNSLECFELCAQSSKKIGFMRAEAYGLSNAGELYAKKGELKKALTYCDSALELFEKLGERYMISTTYQHYGTIYKFKKDWELSKEYFEKSLRIFEELNMPFDSGITLFEFALMYKEKGENKKASEYFEKALDYFEKVGAKKYIERIKLELAKLEK